MRTNKISLFLILATAALAPNARAEIAHFDQVMAGFIDHARPGRTLLISREGEAEWFKGLKIERREQYTITDKKCTPRTQSTMVMGDGLSGQGLTLAYPFLVGVERACYINEETKTIDLLANFRPELPPGTFSAVYAGADDRAAYFLINGRDYPNGESGFLLLVTIDKVTREHSIRELITGVPGLSAAMLYEGDSLWVTTWLEKNDIYQLSTKALHQLIRSGEKGTFAQIAEKKFSDVEGFSFFLLANEKSFLYHNEHYDSYSVSRSNAALGPAPTCTPISGYQQKWLVICDGTSLQLAE